MRNKGKDKYLSKVSSLASRFVNYEQIMEEASKKYEKILSKTMQNKTTTTRRKRVSL